MTDTNIEMTGNNLIYHCSFVPKEYYSTYIQKCVYNPAFVDWDANISYLEDIVVIRVLWKDSY